MTSLPDIKVKVAADTSEALRKIRALREEAQQPPVEVLLVSEKQPFWQGLLIAYLSVMLLALTGGVALMLLLPLAHRTLNVPVHAASYWDCVLLIALVRLTYQSTFGGIRPAASRRRMAR